MLIFLDFDGVLHHAHAHHPVKPFSQLPLFETFFRHKTRQHIHFVIASSWRTHHNLAALQQHFSPDFRQRIIGKTPVLPFCIGRPYGLREREILRYLLQNAPNNRWLALDDNPNLFQNHQDKLYLCNANTGLTEHDLPQLADHINRIQAT